MTEGRQRRLTTIVAADIAGFSRLIGIDEEGILAAQRGHRTELIELLLAKHHGRIANTAGDSFLLEFPSAVEAVRCSVALQNGMAQRNLDIATDRRIEYRIGINVGDVMADGDDLLGDGVNIAARVENICEPGGIILSDDAYRQVRDRLEIAWQDGGEHEVKNIARSIQVWRWHPNGDDTVSPQTATSEPLTLPEKPSIAVLPFQNMSGEKEEEFFADGMAEDIITALSRHRSLFVIARNSTFAYKGQSPDLRQVSVELGVRYVLEGSVRKGGNRVRINAQLIDGPTGNHIWAERYDRTLDDIFAVQDEITQEITACIGPEIGQAERDRARMIPPENLDVWERYQRGLWHLYQFNAEDNAEAQRLFRWAIQASSTFAPAHAALTHALYYSFMHGHAEDRQSTLDEAYASGRAAVAADERDADTHFALGRILYLRRDLTSSLKEFETAVAQNPNFAHAHLGLGSALLYDSQSEQCIEHSDFAARLSPHDPVMWTMLTVKAMGLVGLERYQEAVEVIREAVRQPTAPWTVYLIYAISTGLAGDIGEGADALNHTRRLKSDFGIADVLQIFPFREAANLDRMVEGLRLVGLEDQM